MSTERIKVGDRVRVTRPECTFGDYVTGDTAVVDEIDGDGDLRVIWDRSHDSISDMSRLDLVFTREVEVMQ